MFWLGFQPDDEMTVEEFGRAFFAVQKRRPKIQLMLLVRGTTGR